MKVPVRFASIVRLLRTSAAVGLLVCLGAVGLSALVVAHRSDGRIVSEAADLTAVPVAIVPGARVFPDGSPSVTLQDRLDAALLLYNDGTVAHLLVSGDNRTEHYNEPAAMRDALVAAGVPPADVSVDYAGLDTWDTCLRAADQFAVDEAVVVTQERYAARTAALCRTAGIEVTVLAIDPPAFQRRTTGARRSFRESLAKVKATADMILGTEAAHGGQTIGLVGSEGMPPGGHPPDWDWTTNAPTG